MDRRLLEVVSSMPLSYFKDRTIQVEILKRRFPALATLPLDRNSKQAGYLITPWSQRLRQAIPQAHEISWRLGSKLEGLFSRKESRHYYRSYGLDAPGWQAIQAEASTFEGSGIPFLKPKFFRDSLLRAAEPGRLGDAITTATGVKTVIGLAFYGKLGGFTHTEGAGD
jgi:hypothetical protein